MDNRPIAIFDSGLGGLTAMRELIRLLPGENMIYFGDTGRVPYGNRSRETLVKFARQNVTFLKTFDPKCILAACGTVSANVLVELQAGESLPVLGVVEPAARAAAAATRNGRIGVIGTRATVSSGAYERHLAALAPGAQVISVACPLLVPLVEHGRHRPDDAVVAQIVAEYLAPLRDAGADTLLLGCTHYPLLSEAISAFLGPTVTLVDSGAAGARAIAASIQAGTGSLRRFFVSAEVQDFAALAAIFLRGEPMGPVEQIPIEEY